MSFSFSAIRLFLALVIVGFVSVEAAASPSTNSALSPSTHSVALPLNEALIHQAYEDGNFEAVIAMIEDYTRHHPRHIKSDSIFIAKHLAVIYASNPVTREKGRSYMFRLLSLLPSASIVDMFVSEEIEAIFQKTREEYVIRRNQVGKPATNQVEPSPIAINRPTNSQISKPIPNHAAKSPTTSPPSGEKKKSKHSSAVYWLAGSAAIVAAAGTLVFVLVSNNKSPQDTTIVIPH